MEHGVFHRDGYIVGNTLSVLLMAVFAKKCKDLKTQYSVLGMVLGG